MKTKDKKIPKHIINKLNRDLAKFLPREVLTPRASSGGKFQLRTKGRQKRLLYEEDPNMAVARPIPLSGASDGANIIQAGAFRDWWNASLPDRIANSWEKFRNDLVEGAINMKNEHVDNPHIAMTGFSVEFGLSLGVTLDSLTTTILHQQRQLKITTEAGR